MDMTEWLPIESAPKDGTWILGMNNRGNPAVIIWSPEAGGWIHPFSDMRVSGFWNGDCGSAAEFWMPIKPHPKSTSAPYWSKPREPAPPAPTPCPQVAEPESALDLARYGHSAAMMRALADDDDYARRAVERVRAAVTGPGIRPTRTP